LQRDGTVSDTPLGMAAHMAPPERRNRGAFLLIALGIGLMVFALTDPSTEPDVQVDTGVGHLVTSSPTVLGMVVTTDDGAPAADPAAPATFATGGNGRTPGRTTRPTTSTTERTTQSTTPPPTLAPPWSIENTTTTVDTTTSSTVEDTTTTTTEDTTTTTEETTTTAVG
jgi:hypothetical protein